MSKTTGGERIGKTVELIFACDSVILDSTKGKILLTQKTNNGQWCLPGGRMEPGKSFLEYCVQEVREETGLTVNV